MKESFALPHNDSTHESQIQVAPEEDNKQSIYNNIKEDKGVAREE